MTFPSVKQHTPNQVGAIVCQFTTFPGTPPTYQARVDVLDASLSLVSTVNVDLLPLLTAGQKNAIDSFMTALRTKAAAELLA